MKKIVLVLAGCLVMALFAGCKEEDTVIEGYSFAVDSSSSYSGGIAGGGGGRAFTDAYLESVGCFRGSKIYTGNSLADTNSQAERDFDGFVTNIDRTQLNIALDKDYIETARYEVRRSENSSQADSRPITVKSYTLR